MYRDVQMKLASRFRFDLTLESCCDGVGKDDAQFMAELLDREGNFVFYLDKNRILRRLNLHVFSYDVEDLNRLSAIAGMHKKILPLTNKWFLNVSMSQAYSMVKNSMPYIERKRNLFNMFIAFYEGRKTCHSQQDIVELERQLNRLKNNVFDFKKNSRG